MASSIQKSRILVAPVDNYERLRDTLYECSAIRFIYKPKSTQEDFQTKAPTALYMVSKKGRLILERIFLSHFIKIWHCDKYLRPAILWHLSIFQDNCRRMTSQKIFQIIWCSNNSSLIFTWFSNVLNVIFHICHFLKN